MSKDEVDSKAARALAWTYAGNLPPATDVARAPEPTDEELRLHAERVRQHHLRDEAQLQARLDTLDAQLTALEQSTGCTPGALDALLDLALEPQSCLHLADCDVAFRLATFLLAHRTGLEDPQRQRAAVVAALCLDVDDAPFETWLLAVVRAGDADFCHAVGDSCLEPHAAQVLAGQPQRMAHALEAALKSPGSTPAGKLLALRALNASDWPVERELVAPFLGASDWHQRDQALRLLSDSDQLTGADVLAVLRAGGDGESGLPDWTELDPELDVDDFHDRLARVLRALRPPEAMPLLAELVTLPRSAQDLFSPGWGMCLLAELDPGRAVPAIDAALLAVDAGRRHAALDGLMVLDWALARPRVERMCGDPIPEVARAAQDLFLERARAAPPLDPLAPLPPGRLRHPPSDVLLRRLAIARSPAPEARLKLRDLLVSRARDGQGTVEDTLLLVSLFCDIGLRADPPEVPNIYGGLSSWLAHLRPPLGAELELAAVAMAERFPGGGDHPLLDALAELHGQAPLCPEALTRARQLVHDRVDAGRGSEDRSGALLLAKLGALPERWETLYPAALGVEGWSTFQALVRCGPQPELDARLQRDALGLLDLVVRARVLDLALLRGLGQLVPAALVLLAQAQTQAQVEAAVPLLRTLINQQVLSPDTLRVELADARRPRFLLGYHALRDQAAHDQGIARALTEALQGPVEVAFLALLTLVGDRVLSPNDARAHAVLDRFDLDHKSTALYLLLSQEAAPEALADHLLDVLRRGDEDEVQRVELYLKESVFGRALIAQATRAPARA